MFFEQQEKSLLLTFKQTIQNSFLVILKKITWKTNMDWDIVVT